MKTIDIKTVTVALVTLIAVFGLPNLTRAKEFHELNNVKLSGYSFCAICSVEKTGDEVLWYRFKPKKIFWGSHNDVEDRLYERKERFNFKSDDEMRSREYLILCADRDGASGFSVFKCLPIKQSGVDVRSLGGNKEQRISRDELLELLSNWSDLMLPKHPLDRK